MSQQEDSPSPSGPLTGLKVADFTSVISGSVAAMLLGDLGAEVVKVESPEGDLARWFGPFYKGECGMFMGWNRSKRGIVVDLLKDEGREVAYDLIRKSDIIIENFRPGITERLKIDYETVKAINPGVVYCSITGFGAKGPYGKQPAFDPLFQSMSGAAKANTRIARCGRNACISSTALSDFGSAFLGATGMLAALYHKERTGEGQKVETSLLQGAMALQAHSFLKPLDAKAETLPGIYPYNFYDTKDDVIFIAAGNDKFWQLTCQGIGADEIAEDEKYKTNPGRVANRSELHEKVQPYFLKKTTEEWHKIMIEKGVPCAPALTAAEFFDHPQVTAMDMNPIVEHTKIGRIQMSGIPIHFEKTPGAVRRAAPCLGEHTNEVLKEIGYSADQIEKLRALGAIA